MARCAKCGKESMHPSMCEHCGFDFTTGTMPSAQQSGRPPGADAGESDSPYGLYVYETVLMSPTPQAFDAILTTRPEDHTLESVLDFFIYTGAIFLLGSFMIAWQYRSPFIVGSIILMFLAGVWLARTRALPKFEDGWTEVGLPLALMLSLFVPVVVVFAGFVVHGMATHRIDRTVVRLLTPLFVVVVFLLMVTGVAGPEVVPMRMYGEFRGIELLSLAAVLLGWSSTSWRRLFTDFRMQVM